MENILVIDDDKELCELLGEYMKPEDFEVEAAYNGEKGIVRKIENTAALTAWKNNMLIFEDEPFESVIQSLESWYGVEFQVDERIKSKHRYTFRLKTESLREVLDMISVITPIDYVIEGEKVSIRYK